MSSLAAQTLATWRRLHWSSLLCLLLLTIGGVAFVYSACYRGDGLPVAPFYRKQMYWAVAGWSALFVAAAVDYRRLEELAPWLYGAVIVLLIMTLVMGVTMNRAQRWISLFGMQVQPSEFAKLGLILMGAFFLSRPGRDLESPWVPLQVLLLLGPPFVLIMKQPDLGTAMVLVPIAVAQLWVAGVPVRYLLRWALAAVPVLPMGWLMLGEYQRNRLLVFIDPGRDPLGAGWNKIQSEIAVGSGGLWGKGFLNGTQNVLGFLPRSVAPTDFIYSVVAEETGFVGSVVLVLLYGGVLWGCYRAAVRARDAFGRLLAVGVTTLLFTHLFINLAMTIGLMPITGLPLPLISYGGSFMLSTLLALGLVQSVYSRRTRA
ncbi:MAG: rod shape-determining protein RodA [Candidatus Marinimicrobia bacterium]|nr:rod shape-determining protein RodA [Candidatus Neomarinimicrobiota bacterium]